MEFLQRAIGYSLTGLTTEDCLFLLYGTGRNGKSRLLDACHALLGPYAKTAQMSSFLHQEKDTVRNDLADLHGVRFVSAIETAEGKRLSEGLIKQLTGGDRLKARFLFEEYFEFLPCFKMFLAVNHKPEIRGTDVAIWERIRLIPFTVYIPPEDRDKQLGEKLRQELPGILAWAVRGCLAWQKDGLQPPDAVLHATEAYRNEMDVIGRFLEACCVVAPGDTSVRTQATTLYNAFRDWCTQGGEKEMLTQTAFGDTAD
jgi:putative DNA primase/helicase